MTFKNIDQVDAEDFVGIDSGSIGTVATNGNERVTVDYPIQTGDNEVFVITDVGVRGKALFESLSGGFDETTDDVGRIRYVLSTATTDDPMNDGEEDTKGLALFNWAMYETTVGVHSERSWDLEPTFHNPTVMPFGEGELSVYNIDDSTTNIVAPRMTIRGYTLDVTNEQMTRYLRNLR